MTNPSSFKDLPLFNLLTDADREELASQSLETRYGKDEYIFRQGDPAEWFHILQVGTVKCVRSSPDGRDVTLKVLMPGDLFCCEAAIFDGGAHPGCAKVMDHAKILRINKKSYLDMLRRNPEASLEVITYLAHRLSETQEKAKAFALDRADQRLAALLVNIASKAGITEPNGLRLNVRLTRHDLADMAGLTVETATRIMSHLKREGIVVGTAKRLVIQDLARLKALTI